MERIKKLLISAFILGHIVMMVTSGLPDRSAVGERVLQALSPYQVFFGLDQPWSMFAPNPAAINSYLTATITFKDGSTEQWTFPRASQLDSWDRFTAGERYRKFQQDNLLPMEKNELWFDLSRYVVREVRKLEQAGLKREFEQLHFYRHTNTVQAPTQVFIPHGQMSSNYTSESVFHFKPTGGPRYEASNAH